MTKTTYSFDRDGYYNGEVIAHKSPLEENIYLIPANATEIKPPDFNPEKLRKWTGQEWIEEEKPPKEIQENPTEEELLKLTKNEKYFEVEDIRKNQQFQSIKYQNLTFSASQEVRQNLIGVIIILSDNPENKYPWFDEQKTIHQLSLQDFKNILKEILDRDSKLYLTENQVKKQLDQTSKLKAIQSIDPAEIWSHRSSQN